MFKITSHPILEIPKDNVTSFKFNGIEIKGQKDFTIAAALHQSGYPVHSHSIEGRNRSLACGIGKCGACEMLVDGVVRRIWELLIIYFIYLLKDRSSLFKSLKKYAPNIQSFFILK